MKQCMTPDQANEMNGDTKTARAFAETITTADGKVDTRTVKARRGACP